MLCDQPLIACRSCRIRLLSISVDAVPSRVVEGSWTGVTMTVGCEGMKKVHKFAEAEQGLADNDSQGLPSSQLEEDSIELEMLRSLKEDGVVVCM